MKCRRKYVFVIVSLIVGALLWHIQYNKNRDKQKECEKNRQLFVAIYQWISIICDGKKISDYFYKNNIESVAIYGFGDLGYLLLRQLKKEKYNVLYGIDRNAGSIDVSVPVLRVDEINDEPDLIVVTLIDLFEPIKNELEQYTNAKIISLEELLFRI